MTIEGDQQNRAERADTVLAEVIRFTDEDRRPSLDELCQAHPEIDAELREGYADWLDFGRRLRAEGEAESDWRLEVDDEVDLPSLASTLQEAAAPRAAAVFQRAARWQGSGKLVLGLAALIVLAILILGVVDYGETTYELYAVRGGGQIEADPLFMGPDRSVAELTFRGRAGASRIGQKLRVVSDTTGELLAGYQAEWTKVDVIRLTSSAVNDYSRERVRLEAFGGGVRFKPFSLVTLGSDAWFLDALGFSGQEVDWRSGQRIQLDPEGLELDVWIGGPARDELETLSVRSNYSAARRMMIRERASERNLYAHSLSGLRLKPGPTDLIFNMRDNAGREAEYVLPIEVIADPLLVDVAGIFVAASDSNTNAGEWVPASRSEHGVVLAPDELPILRVETRRESDLFWQLFADDEPLPAASGISRQERIHEAALGLALAELPERVVGGRLQYRVDEGAYVLRSQTSTRGYREDSILFSRSRGHAQFTAFLAASNQRQPLISGGVAYTNGIEAKLLLEKRGEVTARIFVFLDNPEGDRIPISPLTVAPDEQLEIPLPLDGSGLYVLKIQSFQLGPQNSTPVDRPDESQSYRILVDDRAPVLDLNGERALWSSMDQGNALHCVARLHYESSNDVKVRALDFEVLEVESAAALAEPGEIFAGTLEGDSPFELAIQSDDVERDGQYALVVGGQDLAGNQLEPERFEFEVARRGPLIELLQPSETVAASAGEKLGMVWRPDGQGFWSLRLKVSDPNGVAFVEGLLVDGEREVGVEFQSSPSGYIGRVKLARDWSKASASLQLSALDRYGNQSLLEIDNLLISEIKAPIYARVRIGREGIPVNAMLRVQGNHADAYVFGGRGDVIENQLFAASGLRPLNTNPERTPALSFVEMVPAGGIQDFYLDQYEVSNQEFLAFVLDPGGYGYRDNWLPDAPSPAPARMAKLLVRLRDAAPQYPVDGVTFDEARAYAQWVGKRLPTWREWEYAVRGGIQYRPYAHWNGESSQFDSESLARLHARGDGRDRTGDTALWDLDSNLSEWTQSRFPGEPNRYWIAGGSYASAVHDFAVVDDRDRSWSGKTVGFRCAQSAEVVETMIHSDPGSESFHWTGQPDQSGEMQPAESAR